MNCWSTHDVSLYKSAMVLLLLMQFEGISVNIVYIKLDVIFVILVGFAKLVVENEEASIANDTFKIGEQEVANSVVDDVDAVRDLLFLLISDIKLKDRRVTLLVSKGSLRCADRKTIDIAEMRK